MSKIIKSLKKFLTSDLLGVANGIATLDGSAKVPTSQLPFELMEFLGNWDASSNTPSLSDTDTGAQGNTYRVSVAGTVDFGAGPITFAVGDWVYNTGSVWQLGTQTSTPAPVDSVNTQTGVVVLDADDISDATTTNKYVTAADLTTLSNTSGINTGDEVSATDALEGIVELATQSEVDTGTDTTRVITPATLANSTLASDVSTNNAKVSNVTTNLSVGTKTATTVDVDSSDGTNATLPSATITEAGLMSASDKSKLDDVEAGAEVNVQSDWNATSGDAFILNKPTIPAAAPVDSVNTYTGVVVLDADDISDATTTNKFVTATDITNLSNLSGVNTGDEVSATTTVEGIGEIATQTEVNTGTDTTRWVTPATLTNWTGATAQDLASVLTAGNTSGLNDIQMGVNQKIYFGGVLTDYITRNGLTFQIVTDKGFQVVSGANAVLTQGLTGSVTASHFTTGKSIVLNPLGDQIQLNNGTFVGDIQNGTLTANQAWTFPDATGTVALTSDITGINSGTNTGDEVQSTETVQGIIELATQAEVTAGTDTERAVTPATLQVKINAIPAGSDENVKVSANDTTAGYLEDKVVGVTNKIKITTLNDGADEDLEFDIGSDVFDKTVDDTADITEATDKKFVSDAQLTVLSNTSGTNSGDEVQATETVVGIAEIATQVETDTGTDDTRFITPLKLANYPFPTGLVTKAGIVALGTFTGSPKKATVTFSTAFADNLYAVVITGEDSRMWTVESKTASGFTINANASAALTGNTFWTAIKSGES